MPVGQEKNLFGGRIFLRFFMLFGVTRARSPPKFFVCLLYAKKFFLKKRKKFFKYERNVRIFAVECNHKQRRTRNDDDV